VASPDPPYPAAILFNPLNLNFPNTVVGSSSAAKAVTLTNNQSVPLTFSQITTTAEFQQTNNCGTALAPLAQCTVTLKFSPTDIGLRSGSLAITDDAFGSPHTIPLSGVGTFVRVLPVSLSFVATQVGQTSAAQTVVVANTSSAVSVSFSGVVMAGANPADFARTGTCAATTVLAPGAACQMSVRFKPSATGARSAQIQVSDDGGGSPQKVNLSGTGQ
jgi:hypothetical protein